MHGGGLATSSTAVRRWRRGGTAYHHVLDPRTGLPAEPVWRTVTVTAASCVDANTASTAAIVRGVPRPDWLAALGLPSRLVDAAGAVHRVAGWPADREDAGGVSGLLGNPQLTWYLTRASGIVALALLTLSMVLGIVAGTRLSSARWPRFVTQGLHRNISLFVLVLLALHVGAAVLDDYVRITVQESLIPFIGTYRPIWMGLGALASDLVIAMIVTSLLRQRIGYETWRAVHWTAYLCWPLGVVHAPGHGLGRPQDLVGAVHRSPASRSCCWPWPGGIVAGWPRRALLRASAVLLTACAVAIVFTWAKQGPFAPGWSKRSGTTQTTGQK